MVPVAEGSRTADPRPSPRGDSAGPGRSDVGACVERAREPPRALHGGRPGPLSNGSRADVPDRGQRSSPDHEEGTLQGEAADPAGGIGASVSETIGDLAFLRVVERNRGWWSARRTPNPRPSRRRSARSCGTPGGWALRTANLP